MRILVFGNDDSWNELTTVANIEWIRSENPHSFHNINNIDACFDLSDDAIINEHSIIDKPLFINAVSMPLHGLHKGSNTIRINGWPGFLARETWEIAGTISTAVVETLKGLGKNLIVVPDEPGLISARIIAMIINEAYFAKSEGVSTEEEIDVAMKLGTNYPYGPFEWAHKIGIEKIFTLLSSLNKTDKRYKPCPLLEQEAFSIK
ncbi:MAG: 3-hydroxyacyl-CoA dehydrogenase family protein [Ferruginibacter sp.]